MKSEDSLEWLPHHFEQLQLEVVVEDLLAFWEYGLSSQTGSLEGMKPSDGLPPREYVLMQLQKSELSLQNGDGVEESMLEQMQYSVIWIVPSRSFPLLILLHEPIGLALCSSVEGIGLNEGRLEHQTRRVA